VGVERRPVHRGVACAACPGCVSAAVTEASDVADEGLIGPEWVAVWACCGALTIHAPEVDRTKSPTAGDSLIRMAGA